MCNDMHVTCVGDVYDVRGRLLAHVVSGERKEVRGEIEVWGYERERERVREREREREREKKKERESLCLYIHIIVCY